MKKVLLIIMLFFCNACMTIFTKRYQFIYVSSEPVGAVVKLNGGKVGVTPMQVPIKKTYEWPKISVEKEGYLPEDRYLPSTLNPWAVLGNNIAIWAWIIDGSTGKFLRYRTKKYHFILKEDTTKVVR
jgi:hypothetical protein